VKKSQNLLNLTLDIGGETRTVFSGIKSAFTNRRFRGQIHVIGGPTLRHVNWKFGLSEGMVLAAGPGGEELFLSF